MATALTKLDNNANMLDILNTLNELNNQQALLNNKLYMLLQDQNLEVTNDMTLSELIEATEEGFSNMSTGSSDKDAEIENLRAQLVSLNSQITDLNNQLAGKVTPAGTAVAGNVLSGKTFINSTGQTITGTMTNRGGAQTVTPGTSNKTLYSGYYSGNITVQGDSDLIASNIKSGVNIFGVTGSYAGSSSSLTTKTINTEFGLDDIYNGSKTISVNMGSKTPSLIILNGYINIVNSYYDDVTTVSEISMIGVNGTGFSGSNNGENEARFIIYNMLVDGTDLDIKFKIKSYTSSSITLQMIASDRDLVYNFCYDDCLLIFIQEVYYM
jgi:hypothetical protein